jgi:hypothetical protein
VTFSCKEKVTADFNFPDIKDIDEITTVLLFHDTLPIFKKPHIPDTTISQDGHKLIHYPLVAPICLGLRKIKVLLPDTTSIPGPPPFEAIRLTSLFNIEIDGKKIFNSKDSTFFFAQNDTLFNFQLPNKYRDTLRLTSIEVENKKNDKQKYSADFYDISLPIFSADLKTAYVEIRHMCSMCGGASAYILQKVNGHWQIKNSFGLWIS